MLFIVWLTMKNKEKMIRLKCFQPELIKLFLPKTGEKTWVKMNSQVKII